MGRPTSALIVDDEPHVRVFVKLLLQQLGVTQFWEAADGRTALHMAATLHPEVMLLDINMPVMNGLEVLRAMNAAGSDVPVIMLTSLDAMKIVVECRRNGAAGYVLKHSPKSEAMKLLSAAFDAIAEGQTGEGAEQPS